MERHTQVSPGKPEFAVTYTYVHTYIPCVCVCVISLSSSTVDGMVNEKEKDMVRMLDSVFILTLQQLA